MTIALIGPESSGKSTLAQSLAQQFRGICFPEYARTYLENKYAARSTLNVQPSTLNVKRSNVEPSQPHTGYTYADVVAIARHQIAELKYAKTIAELRYAKTVSYSGARSGGRCCRDHEIGRLRDVSGCRDHETGRLRDRCAARNKSTGIHESSICFFDTDLITTKVWFEVRYGSCPAFVLEAMSRYRMDFYILCYPDLPWVSDSTRTMTRRSRSCPRRRARSRRDAASAPWRATRRAPDAPRSVRGCASTSGAATTRGRRRALRRRRSTA